MLDPLIVVVFSYIMIRAAIFIVGWCAAIAVALFMIYILLFHYDNYHEKIFDVKEMTNG